MTRVRGRFCSAILIAAALAGCMGEDREAGEGAAPSVAGGDASEMVMPEVVGVEEAQDPGFAARGVFAVSHELGIGVGPQWVRPHFLKVRDACLNEEALRCELLEASASTGRRDGGFSSATVVVRLPHEAVASFKVRAAGPLEGEDASEIEIRRDRTQAANMARPIADIERRKKQLEAYRDRLETLGSWAESRVEDLIKIAEEVSRVQAEIEALEGEQRALSEQVAAERVRVVFEAVRPAVPAADPVSRVFANAARIFWQSAADALAFLLRIVPWLPLAAVLAGAVIGFVRLVRRY